MPHVDAAGNLTRLGVNLPDLVPVVNREKELPVCGVNGRVPKLAPQLTSGIEHLPLGRQTSERQDGRGQENIV